jgi:hypothetical protein
MKTRFRRKTKWREREREKEKEKEPTVETGVRVDPSDHSGGGWTDAWNLLRGRRKD